MESIWIGFDPREAAAFFVCRNSIRRHTLQPIPVRGIILNDLQKAGLYTRPVERRGEQLYDPISAAPMSTEFAISRFCVPFLQDTGWALFADCDIICWSDIKELFDLADDRYAVMVVKHGLEPLYAAFNGLQKMDGQIQTVYQRKNWSSVVLWNCGHPANRQLTLERLNNWPGRDLHAFKWLGDDEIGELPQEWNWLIGVTEGAPEKRGIWHYTLGGPWFKDWKPAGHDDDWLEEANTKKERAA